MEEVGDRKVLVHCWVNARASALVHVFELTQSAENSEIQIENLNKIWKDVAGYDLDTNGTWKRIVEQYATVD